MSAIGVIAVNAFRESLRDKILYNLVLFAGLLIGLSVLLADLSITEHHKVIADMGLAAINLIGVIIAIFIGISLVNKEIERRTIYTIMARPISRTVFIMGEILWPGADVVSEYGRHAGRVPAYPLALPRPDRELSLPSGAIDVRRNSDSDCDCTLFFDVHLVDSQRYFYPGAVCHRTSHCGPAGDGGER